MNELSDILNYTGEDPDNYFGSVAPPLVMASNFRFKTVEDFRTAIRDEQNHLVYSRGNNPTVDILCQKVAALEKAEAALAFASGMAAISGANLRPVTRATPIPFYFIRLSDGLESPDLLINDLTRAFERVLL